MQTCPKCSAKTRDERRYCPKCGAALLKLSPELTEKEAKKSRLKSRIYKGILLFLAASLFVSLLSVFIAARLSAAHFTDPYDLADQYIRRFSKGNAKNMARLFIPDLVSEENLDSFDAFCNLYGLPLESFGSGYDITDTSLLSADLVHRLIRNEYGLQVEVSDYIRVLIGGITNGSDIWFELDMALVDGYWYIYQVTAQ